jgi:hypothetical protein
VPACVRHRDQRRLGAADVEERAGRCGARDEDVIHAGVGDRVVALRGREERRQRHGHRPDLQGGQIGDDPGGAIVQREAEALHAGGRQHRRELVHPVAEQRIGHLALPVGQGDAGRRGCGVAAHRVEHAGRDGRVHQDRGRASSAYAASRTRTASTSGAVS